jgi:hypothetical protein
MTMRRMNWRRGLIAGLAVFVASIVLNAVVGVWSLSPLVFASSPGLGLGVYRFESSDLA